MILIKVRKIYLFKAITMPKDDDIDTKGFRDVSYANLHIDNIWNYTSVVDKCIHKSTLINLYRIFLFLYILKLIIHAF